MAAIYLELISGKEIFQSSSNNDQLHLLLSLCGYPEVGSKENNALQKMNIRNSNRNTTLDSLTKNLDFAVK